MANSDKNILITPNKGQVNDPTIVITGQGNDPITATISDDNTPLLQFKDSANTNLFSVDDSSNSPTLFSISSDSPESRISVDSNKNVNLNDSVEIVGSGLVLPSIQSSTLSQAKEGLMVHNSTDATLSVSNGTRWFNCGPVKDVVKNELILHLDSFDANSYSSGTTWTDLTGTFGNINVQNLSTQWSFQTEPQTGKPCLFNSTNNAASTGIAIPTARINKRSGTIELWIKPGDYTGGHGYFVNGDGGNNTNVNGWLWFGVWDNGGRLYFRLSSSTSCCSDNSAISPISNRWLISNIWHQVAVAWNVNAGFLRSTIFIDGRAISRVGHASNIENFHCQDTGQLFNGHDRTDNEQFKGYCSEYRIYNRELSYDEMWNNFEARRERYGI